MFHKAFFIWITIVVQVWAIIDIAPVEVGDKPGLSGNVAGSYASKSGNTVKDQYDIGAKVQYDSNTSYITFAQVSYERGESYNIKTEDEQFAHLRYLHKLNDETLYGELYIQHKENAFKDIDKRLLTGGGVRLRFINDKDWGKLYFGVGAFYETIEYTLSPLASPGSVIEPDETATRVNSYLAYKTTISDTTKINIIGYYQPDVDNTSDHYTSFIAEAIIQVYKKLYLSLLYEVDYDAQPASGVKKQDRTAKTSLIWKF